MQLSLTQYRLFVQQQQCLNFGRSLPGGMCLNLTQYASKNRVYIAFKPRHQAEEAGSNIMPACILLLTLVALKPRVQTSACRDERAALTRRPLAARASSMRLALAACCASSESPAR